MKRRSWMSFITRHALALQWLEIIFDLLSRSNDPNYLQISYGWPQPQPADLGCCSHHRMGATLKHIKCDISYLVPDKCEVSNTGLTPLHHHQSEHLLKKIFLFNIYNEPSRSIWGLRRIESKFMKSMRNTNTNIIGPDIPLG